MKPAGGFRDRTTVDALRKAIAQTTTKPWRIMEVCGGQTHAIARYRLEELLPPEIRLLHGPGCPVCVTPAEVIDQAVALAKHPGMTIATFGDMLRVCGTKESLSDARSQGADVRILYSPLDAVEIAVRHPDREVVFLAIGFETTLPAHLAALEVARKKRLKNFSLLTALFSVIPAMREILSEEGNGVDGFLAAGHVCTVTGTDGYAPLSETCRVPVVITGFEPVDLLYGLYLCIRQLEAGTYRVENAYRRAVSGKEPPFFAQLRETCLERCPAGWRGIGVLPASGFRLKEEYKVYDAAVKFREILPHVSQPETSVCIAGEIMRGRKQPAECPYFGIGCQPSHPIGAPMISSEGVCAAYYYSS